MSLGDAALTVGPSRGGGFHRPQGGTACAPAIDHRIDRSERSRFRRTREPRAAAARTEPPPLDAGRGRLRNGYASRSRPARPASPRPAGPSRASRDGHRPRRPSLLLLVGETCRLEALPRQAMRDSLEHCDADSPRRCPTQFRRRRRDLCGLHRLRPLRRQRRSPLPPTRYPKRSATSSSSWKEASRRRER